MQQILLIEDNRDIATMLFDFFESENITLDYADNGKQGLELALKNNFDAIILDVMLPDMNGFSLCKNLRNANNTTPVLMLTALASKEDLLSGFDFGADDYLTKPFDLDVLKARLFALIRRHQNELKSVDLVYDTLRINLKTREVYRENRPIMLKPTSFSILELLMRKAPNIVTRQEIFRKIWNEDECKDEILRSQIYQLRTQIDKTFSYSLLITVPKVGFRLSNLTKTEKD